MFCKHNYEIIDKTIMESPYEQIVKVNPNTVDRKVKVRSVRTFFSKKLVILLKCSKCKDIKKETTTNPEQEPW